MTLLEASAESLPASRTTKRTAATKRIGVDRSAADSLRAGFDLELTNRRGTTTPARWVADTCTETALNFVQHRRPTGDRFAVGLGTRVDVDQFLALFTLLHHDMAVANRDLLIGAAGHSTLQATAPRRSVMLAQELTLTLERRGAVGPVGRQRRALALVRAMLDGTQAASPAAVRAWEHIERGHRALRDGTVHTETIGARFAMFVLPRHDRNKVARALNVPRLGATLDRSSWLWPHARNQHHGERVHLVCVPTSVGCFYDLSLPGYCWANTPDRWFVPGLTTRYKSVLDVRIPELDEAVARLAGRERCAGSWRVARSLRPWDEATATKKLQWSFSVVASFTDAAGAPAPSSLAPDRVASTLAEVFAAA